MNTVRVENTTDAAVYLPLGADHGPITIPRAVKKKERNEKTGDDRMITTNGAAEVDGDKLVELRKTNKIVARYFSEGRLKEVGSGPPPNPSGQGNGSKGK